jgi:hypothetical protein
MNFNDDGSLPEDGFRLLIEDVKKVAKVEREVAFSEVADLTILKEAQKELGIKGKQISSFGFIAVRDLSELCRSLTRLPNHWVERDAADCASHPKRLDG